jgi:hypothetical protein
MELLDVKDIRLEGRCSLYLVDDSSTHIEEEEYI